MDDFELWGQKHVVWTCGCETSEIPDVLTLITQLMLSLGAILNFDRPWGRGVFFWIGKRGPSSTHCLSLHYCRSASHWISMLRLVWLQLCSVCIIMQASWIPGLCYTAAVKMAVMCNKDGTRKQQTFSHIKAPKKSGSVIHKSNCGSTWLLSLVRTIVSRHYDHCGKAPLISGKDLNARQIGAVFGRRQ